MTVWFPTILMAAILLLMETGRWFGIRRRSRNPDGSSGGGGVEAAVFGLMGLLIAFTFYGAENRFETRRGMIVEEANAISAAYHRLDLLPPGAQPRLREEFRQYVRSRLAIYEKVPDWEAVDAMNVEIKHSTAIQKEIWRQAMEATKGEDETVQALIVPALDRMVDIAAIQTVAFQSHPPAAVWAMLALTLLASCVLAGYTMSGSGVRNWVHILAFALLFSAVVYVNLDFEYPRMWGFIRINDLDKLLVQALENM